MPRPLWTDAGTDPNAIAAFLEAKAQEAAPHPLDFVPRPLATGTDTALLHQAAILRIRAQLAARHGEADRIVAQEVAAIDDMVRAANLLVERLREWYGLHAPEVPRLEPDAERLAARIAEHGDRASVLAAMDQADVAERSLGSAMGEADLAVLQSFAAALREVQNAWRRIEERVRDAMSDLAPNLVTVTGPIVGARLIALAGGLERLATLPASTVQLLGAETALFRHLKEGTRPPKHGVLFQHPLIHQAPPWQRGAIARSLALHASRAARADGLTHNDLRDSLKTGLETDVARIRQDKKAAPKRPARGPRGGRRGPPQGGSAGAGGKAERRGPGPRAGPPAGGAQKSRGKPAGKRGKPRFGDGPAKPPGRGK